MMHVCVVGTTGKCKVCGEGPFKLKPKKDPGVCAYGNCQNKVTGDRLYCDECRDNL